LRPAFMSNVQARQAVAPGGILKIFSAAPKNMLKSAAHLMKTSKRNAITNAFTRWELLIVMAALAALAVLALPMLAQPFSHSARLVCLNNLRQIGQAFQIWGNDHDDQAPFFLLFDDVSGLPSGAYRWFGMLSNQLVTPGILACPSDPAARPAVDFGNSPNGGFFNLLYRDKAVSYFLTHRTIGTGPELLSGDANVSGTAGSAGCSYFSPSAQQLPKGPSSAAQWTKAVHIDKGNVLSTAGDAQELSSAGLRQMVQQWPPQGFSSYHLLLPQR
jgi:hypothetical protein